MIEVEDAEKLSDSSEDRDQVPSLREISQPIVVGAMDDDPKENDN